MARTDDHTVHGAAHDVIADSAPAQARDEFTERVFAAFEDDDVAPAGAAAGALQVLRRGLATSPELRDGLKATIVFAIVAAAGKLAIPILIQVILDRGVLGSSGFRAEFVLLACLAAVAITIGVLFISRGLYCRLVWAAEQALCKACARAVRSIHRLSMAEHTGTAQVASRVASRGYQTLARLQWG
jgi:putative ABC transport system ATP-binding protein